MKPTQYITILLGIIIIFVSAELNTHTSWATNKLQTGCIPGTIPCPTETPTSIRTTPTPFHTIIAPSTATIETLNTPTISVQDKLTATPTASLTTMPTKIRSTIFSSPIATNTNMMTSVPTPTKTNTQYNKNISPEAIDATIKPIVQNSSVTQTPTSPIITETPVIPVIPIKKKPIQLRNFIVILIGLLGILIIFSIHLYKK